MSDDVKTVDETALSLGICRKTVFNLLKNGELQRAPFRKNGGRGKPTTMVTTVSVTEYRNRRRSKK